MDCGLQSWPYANPAQVSAKGNVKAVAGKIAHSAREGEVPAALCIGPECINVAIKVRVAWGHRRGAKDQHTGRRHVASVNLRESA